MHTAYGSLFSSGGGRGSSGAAGRVGLWWCAALGSAAEMRASVPGSLAVSFLAQVMTEGLSSSSLPTSSMHTAMCRVPPAFI
jgi:hypothetical protein